MYDDVMSSAYRLLFIFSILFVIFIVRLIHFYIKYIKCKNSTYYSFSDYYQKNCSPFDFIILFITKWSLIVYLVGWVLYPIL
jgi:hypothetical protein